MSINTGKLYSFYLAIVSFVALVAIAINLGIVLTSIGQYFLITDDEYLQNREYYKIEQCETGNNLIEKGAIDPNTGRSVSVSKVRTQEEIDGCKENVKASVSASRSYSMKEMFISSGAWMVVFLIIFAFHYPKFLREKK